MRIWVPLSLPDQPTGGNLGPSAAATVDAYACIALVQTTPVQEITIRSPTDTISGGMLFLLNTGTALYSVTGLGTIVVGGAGLFMWIGSAWFRIGVS